MEELFYWINRLPLGIEIFGERRRGFAEGFGDLFTEMGVLSMDNFAGLEEDDIMM